MECSEKHQRLVNGLIDDVLIEILSRLPIKSIHRFKCVSTAWKALISDGCYRKKLPPAILGLFYNVGACSPNHRWRCEPEYISILNVHDNSYVGTSLDFLPINSSNMRVMDCWNGLFLCCSSDASSSTHYVCNPATRKWNVLPDLPNKFMVIALAFDPHISYHYKVVCIRLYHSSAAVELDIFSSEMCRWVTSRVCLGSLRWSIRCLHLRDSVFLNGVIHVLSFQDHILGIDLEKKVCWKIELPAFGARDQSGRLGQSRGYLCYSLSGGDIMKVWFLENYDRSEWVLKHSVNIKAIIAEKCIKEDNALSPRHSSYRCNVLAFHPYVNVVYLRTQGKLLSYNWNNAHVTDLQPKELSVAAVLLCLFA